MTIGERIRKIRDFRNLTQKELGVELGFPESNAGIRIAQYESNTRVPKKETSIQISKVLKCNYISIYDGTDLGSAERTMQNLFWLEELSSVSLFVYPLERYSDKTDNVIVTGKYNSYNFPSVSPPIGIAMSYNIVNNFMNEWAIRKEELQSSKISKDEYFEWKINWPSSCDDCGKTIPTYKWKNQEK